MEPSTSSATAIDSTSSNSHDLVSASKTTSDAAAATSVLSHPKIETLREHQNLAEISSIRLHSPGPPKRFRERDVPDLDQPSKQDSICLDSPEISSVPLHQQRPHGVWQVAHSPFLHTCHPSAPFTQTHRRDMSLCPFFHTTDAAAR